MRYNLFKYIFSIALVCFLNFAGRAGIVFITADSELNSGFASEISLDKASGDNGTTFTLGNKRVPELIENTTIPSTRQPLPTNLTAGLKPLNNLELTRIENSANKFIVESNIIDESISQNLVAHWKLDNNSNDDSGNGIDGSAINAPTFTSGVVGSHALELNGVNQYIDFGNPLQLPSGKSPRTMSAWMKTNSITDEWRFAVAYGQATSLKAMSIGQKGTTLLGGAYGSALSVEDFWTVGVWHHVVFTYDGDTARLYTDGVERGSMYEDWSLTPDKAYIGRQISNDQYWNGAIDDVRIYNKALSEAEITDLYNQNANNNLAAPGNLRARFLSGSSVQLTWDDNSDNEEGFIVERSVNGGIFSQIDNVSSDTKDYYDDNIQFD